MESIAGVKYHSEPLGASDAARPRPKECVLKKKTDTATKSPERGLDRHWHLANDEFEIGVTEFEFSIFRVAAAFERWQSDCLRCCLPMNFSGTDTAVLHVIRMHNRPKGISELCRLLNRDDQSNLQYTVRKLLKAGLIEKSQSEASKRDVAYVVTEEGQRVTDQYARFRQELLLSITRTALGTADLDAIARSLNMMAAMYDQASCIAATHRVSE